MFICFYWLSDRSGLTGTEIEIKFYEFIGTEPRTIGFLRKLPREINGRTKRRPNPNIQVEPSKNKTKQQKAPKIEYKKRTVESYRP